jgi:uncharacterized membrane protein
MDLVLFSLYVALMGALSFLIALLTRLHIQAKRGELRNTPDVPIDVEKLRDFKASILPLVIALVLVIIAFYITVFLYPIPTPLDACTTNTTANNICNYLISIM